MTFAGAAYDPRLDRARLTVQIERIRKYLLGAGWRTLFEIESDLEALYRPARFPSSSCSAQLRNLRKKPFGYRLEKRRRAGVRGPGAGIWEYRLLQPLPPAQLELLEKKSDQAPQAVPATRDDAGGEPDDGGGREEFLKAARRIVTSMDSK